jgi:hypothetical protein
LLNHQRANIAAPNTAHRQLASVAVNFAHFAFEPPPSYDPPQGGAGLSVRTYAAADGFPLWRVHSPEHDAMLADAKAIAVLHRGAASDGGRFWLRLRLHGRNRDANGEHQPNRWPNEFPLAAYMRACARRG